MSAATSQTYLPLVTSLNFASGQETSERGKEEGERRKMGKEGILGIKNTIIFLILKLYFHTITVAKN
jgi:hypothetical protein